jgi:adenylosuccinate lyase
MIPRYTRPDMAALWTDEFRWKTILEIELLAAESYARSPEDRRAVRVLRRKARVNVRRILAIEKTTKHDVIAFVSNVAENVGPSGRYSSFLAG